MRLLKQKILKSNTLRMKNSTDAQEGQQMTEAKLTSPIIFIKQEEDLSNTSLTMTDPNIKSKIFESLSTSTSSPSTDSLIDSLIKQEVCKLESSTTLTSPANNIKCLE